MAVTTRGMRITDEAMEQLRRLVLVLKKPQYVLLARAIGNAYEETLKHPKYGPVLIALEKLDAQEDDKGKPERVRKGRGAVVRLNEQEALELRRLAYEETGDPGQAQQLAREAIRQKLLENPSGRTDGR